MGGSASAGARLAFSTRDRWSRATRLGRCVPGWGIGVEFVAVGGYVELRTEKGRDLTGFLEDVWEMDGGGGGDRGCVGDQGGL